MQALEEADVFIVNTAKDITKVTKNVVIIGQDIDLLILMPVLSEYWSNLYLLKPGIGTITSKLYDPNSFIFPHLSSLGFIIHMQ